MFHRKIINLHTNMRKLSLILTSVALALCSAQALAYHEQLPRSVADSAAGERSRAWTEMSAQRKMAHSAYPVSLSVRGNSLCVKSPKEQELPIYTQGGALYLTMRLGRGDNWLYGLPRGRYRINNRVVSIL